MLSGGASKVTRRELLIRWGPTREVDYSGHGRVLDKFTSFLPLRSRIRNSGRYLPNKVARDMGEPPKGRMDFSFGA